MQSQMVTASLLELEIQLASDKANAALLNSKPDAQEITGLVDVDGAALFRRYMPRINCPTGMISVRTS